MLVAFVILTFVTTLAHFLRSESLMSHFGAQYDDLLQAFKVNTDKVAEKLDHLLADAATSRLAGDPMTDAQFDGFAAIRDHLAALGSDVQAPTPAVPAAVLAIPVTEHPAALPVVSDARPSTPAPKSTSAK